MSKKKMALVKPGNARAPGAPGSPGDASGGPEGAEGGGENSDPHYNKVRSKMDNLMDMMAQQGLVDSEKVTVVVDEKFASDEANEAKSPPDEMAMSREDLRRIYGVLSAKMNERILGLLERMYDILEMKGTDKEVLARIETVINEAEEMEAMVAALDGLTRNCDDSEIRDPDYVSRYLRACMQMRTEGQEARRAGKKGS